MSDGRKGSSLGEGRREVLSVGERTEKIRRWRWILGSFGWWPFAILYSNSHEQMLDTMRTPQKLQKLSGTGVTVMRQWCAVWRAGCQLAGECVTQTIQLKSWLCTICTLRWSYIPYLGPAIPGNRTSLTVGGLRVKLWISYDTVWYHTHKRLILHPFTRIRVVTPHDRINTVGLSWRGRWVESRSL